MNLYRVTVTDPAPRPGEHRVVNLVDFYADEPKEAVRLARQNTRNNGLNKPGLVYEARLLEQQS